VKETKVESPLDKLKDIKRKVSAKIDKVEET
jgi:hypothetical protein